MRFWDSIRYLSPIPDLKATSLGHTQTNPNSLGSMRGGLLAMKKTMNERYLAITFVIGGIYDIILGISLLFFVDLLSEILDEPKPDPLIFTQVSGVFLIVIGYFLLYAAQSPRKLAFVGAGSVVARLSYSIIVLSTWLLDEISIIYVFFGLTDALTALLILLALLLTDAITYRQLWEFEST